MPTMTACPASRDTNRMKRLFLSISLTACLLLSSCGLGLVKLTVNADGSVSDADGTTYRYCSVSISPITVGKKYGRASGGYNLYAVDGLEPSKWLCEGEGAISLVYAENSLERPDFLSFEPEGAVLSYTPDEKRLELGSVDDNTIISEIIRIFTEDEDVPLPSSVSDVYDVSFTSSKYPGLYYMVQYLKGSDGRTYLRDRGTERCVYANDVLGVEEEAESTT